jgi:hypothetical protein
MANMINDKQSNLKINSVCLNFAFKDDFIPVNKLNDE